MPGTATINFGEVLDISFAAKLHTQLKDNSVIGGRVCFVSSDLTRIDTSCLQVLTSFMKYADENDIDIEWQEPSETVKEAARLTGLDHILKLDS